jgi:hypothetical protein
MLAQIPFGFLPLSQLPLESHLSGLRVYQELNLSAAANSPWAPPHHSTNCAIRNRQVSQERIYIGPNQRIGPPANLLKNPEN